MAAAPAAPVTAPARPAAWRVRLPALGGRMWTGLGILALILLCSAFVPMITGQNPYAINPLDALRGPSLAHLMGTDQYGRDILTRAALAARLDLFFGTVPVAASLLIGATAGLVSGYFGGWADTVLMRLVDVMFAFPYLVLVISIIAIIGPGIFGMMIALVVVDWTVYARLTRGEVLQVKGQEYVVAGRLLGYSPARLVVRHVLPNVVTPALVYSMVDVVNTILLAATLSFLGLGVQPPTPEWGAMISDGQNFVFQAWWMTVMPGLALMVTGVALSLVADGLAELIDRG